jgi:hypothetical protein
MQKRQPEGKPLEKDVRKTVDEKPKDGLKDLDVTQEDGAVVKGGVPKTPD